ncbi:TPA: phage tail protein [Enterobacter hormaechei subsp. xiangfangensis]|nr:phage tail protein [Enterobacter hormaechei subsp. xiangfangensis]HAV1890627.1 phage tail protein [Enterobacter hormaechei subsp. xiangfangensis]
MANFFSIIATGTGTTNFKDYAKGVGFNLMRGVLERSFGSIEASDPGADSRTAKMASDKSMLKAALRMAYAQGWQWTVEVAGFSQFQMFVKDINYTPISIETETKNIGGIMINRPTLSASSTISMTVRDTEDGAVKRWFTSLAKRVINADGTINLPTDYLVTLNIYNILSDGTRQLTDTFEVFATNLGDITRGRDQISEFFSYPITWTIYSSGLDAGNGGGNVMNTVGTIITNPSQALSRAGGNMVNTITGEIKGTVNQLEREANNAVNNTVSNVIHAGQNAVNNGLKKLFNL